jgi:hypothetical protein
MRESPTYGIAYAVVAVACFSAAPYQFCSPSLYVAQRPVAIGDALPRQCMLFHTSEYAMSYACVC